MRKYGNYTSEGYDTKANYAWQTSSSGELPRVLVSKTRELSEHYCKFAFPFMTTLVCIRRLTNGVARLYGNISTLKSSFCTPRAIILL